MQQLREIKLGDEARGLFPIFSEQERRQAKRLSYLDTAASSQKLRVCIETLSDFLSHEYANIHRGAYALSAHATKRYEEARETAAQFIQAPSSRNVIFTRGATESINLVCHAIEDRLNPGDTVLISLLEHHSNFVPWQLLAKRRKLELQFANITPQAAIDSDDLLSKIRKYKPKIVSITQLSNAFGSITNLKPIYEAAQECQALLCIDGAQGVVHGMVNVQSIGCDFYAFSGHKAYGPTGIGVLYASDRALAMMEPFQGGGSMISSVSAEGSSWAEPPQKFEAGTPPIAEAIAFGSTLKALLEIGLTRILEHERAVFKQAIELLRKEPGVELYGPALLGKASLAEQASIIALNVKGIHPHDLSTVADSFNVQIRAGHHCAMPALKSLGLQSTARASIGMYTTIADFEALCDGIRAARKMFC